MSAFKFLSFLFPFIKEMVLGDKTIRESLKTNKIRVLVVFLILFSFLVNFWAIPKLIKTAAYAVQLEHEMKEPKSTDSSASAPIVGDKPEDKPPQTVKPPDTSASAPDASSDSAADNQEAVDAASSGVKASTAPLPPTTTKVRPLPRPRNLGRPKLDDRYDEWRKSFDTIKSKETDASRAGPAYPGPAQEEELRKTYAHH